MQLTIQKPYLRYQKPAPRYTAYPSVPHWNTQDFTVSDWEKIASERLQQASRTGEGIAIYIHLPYCESLCTYCGCNTRITTNHQLEIPYIEQVLREWNMYAQLAGGPLRIEQLHLGGGTPTFFSPTNLDLLIKDIFSRAVKSSKAEFSFEGHPANTTHNHLQTLRNLGFARVSFGIQDFDPVVQQAINRYQTVQDVARVMRWSRQAAYTSINFDLVYGLPFQTLTGLKKTIEQVITLSPDRIAFYAYAHVPWMKPWQRLFTEADLPGVVERYELQQLGRKLFTEAGYHEIGMDHYAWPDDDLSVAQAQGRLFRDFMGYTTRSSTVLIGLGASAISDISSAYAQNEKSPGLYANILKQNLLPITKGHLLSPDDQYWREHIQNLMCKGETFWDTLGSRQEVWKQKYMLLQPFIEDGLAELSPGSLRITPAGKDFVRQICMALDEYSSKRDARLSQAV